MLSVHRLRRAEHRARVILSAWRKAGSPCLTLPPPDSFAGILERQRIREFAYRADLRPPSRVFGYLRRAEETGSPVDMERIWEAIRNAEEGSASYGHG